MLTLLTALATASSFMPALHNWSMFSGDTVRAIESRCASQTLVSKRLAVGTAIAEAGKRLGAIGVTIDKQAVARMMEHDWFMTMSQSAFCRARLLRPDVEGSLDALQSQLDAVLDAYGEAGVDSVQLASCLITAKSENAPLQQLHDLCGAISPEPRAVFLFKLRDEQVARLRSQFPTVPLQRPQLDDAIIRRVLSPPPLTAAAVKGTIEVISDSLGMTLDPSAVDTTVNGRLLVNTGEFYSLLTEMLLGNLSPEMTVELTVRLAYREVSDL